MPRRLFDSTLHVSLTYTERCACLDVLQRFPAWAAARAGGIQHCAADHRKGVLQGSVTHDARRALHAIKK